MLIYQYKVLSTSAKNAIRKGNYIQTKLNLKYEN